LDERAAHEQPDHLKRLCAEHHAHADVGVYCVTVYAVTA
jgi:hypothetical protein